MQSKPVQIVVGFDFTKSATIALRRSLSLAARAPFHVLHIVCAIDPHNAVPAVPHRGRVTYEYAELVQHELTSLIARELREAKIVQPIQFYVHARIGRPASEILQLAREVGAELVIVGTKELGGIERALLGSVAGEVVRDAWCTVEVARPLMYPHVDLLAVREVDVEHRYVPPHRYRYDQSCAQLRPDEWPLY
jgi:nucleotide-binding universal stress UspA family protein